MIESKFWHPIALATTVPSGGLIPVTLLDQALVVWRSSSGALNAWRDQCPHRGAALSLGCVRGESLQCAYHGWRFDPAGQCVSVPATPLTPTKASVDGVYTVREAYGLIWVRLSSEPHDALPPFGEFADPRLRKIYCGPYEVATSAPRVVENFLDMAHFGFVHAGTLGDPAHTEVLPYVVNSFDDARGRGIIATACRAYQPQSNATIVGGSQVEYTYRVPAPYTAILTKLPAEQSGFEEAIALFVSPVSQEQSRVWFVLAMTDYTSSEAALRAFQDGIFAEDKPIIESQRPKRLPLNLRAEAHCTADKMSSAYRRCLSEQGFTFGVIVA